MKISVIIPTYNEAKLISNNIRFIIENGGNLVSEVIVVDAKSEDDTVSNAKNAGADVYVSLKRGRASQMNYGAQKAKSEILYFVHADAIPPKSFAADIIKAVNSNFGIGCFRLKFDSSKKMFFFNEWFTRFDYMWCRGGDQTMFVTKNVFDKLDGFDEKFVIMEEYDFIFKARKIEKFKILTKSILVSARKYENNSWLKVMIANYKAYNMFIRKVEPQKIKEFYNSTLK